LLAALLVNSNPILLCSKLQIPNNKHKKGETHHALSVNSFQKFRGKFRGHFQRGCGDQWHKPNMPLQRITKHSKLHILVLTCQTLTPHKTLKLNIR